MGLRVILVDGFMLGAPRTFLPSDFDRFLMSMEIHHLEEKLEDILLWSISDLSVFLDFWVISLGITSIYPREPLCQILDFF